MTYRISKITSN